MRGVQIMRAIPLAIILALSASGSVAARAPADTDWRTIIRPRDRERLRDWRATWVQALAQARQGGAGARIEAEGVLLQPDTAIVSPEAPDGDYRCRVIKLGAAAPGAMTYSAHPALPCRIADGRFAMLGGPQRPTGRLWRLDDLRRVFLGAISVGDETGSLDYGRDPDRDAAGVFERIADDRWRMILPKPKWGSLLDVIEIVPASAQAAPQPSPAASGN